VETELRRAAHMAASRLSVAQQIGLPMAVCMGALCQLVFGSWLLSAVVVVAAYQLVTLPYRRAAAEAQHRCFQSSVLGNSLLPKE